MTGTPSGKVIFPGHSIDTCIVLGVMTGTPSGKVVNRVTKTEFLHMEVRMKGDRWAADKSRYEGESVKDR